MKKITVVTVDLSPAFHGHVGEEEFRAVLEMLRFAGLLRSNVKGFPGIIEYDAIPGQVAGKNDVARWASFGYKATTRLEYK